MSEVAAVPLVDPIEQEKQALVIAETERYIALAGEILECHFEPIPVSFDLKGQTSGMFKMIGRGRKAARVIRYNPWVFAKFWQDSFDTTIPHEVAHYIVEQLYGRRATPHGPEWKAVMALFGADDSRTSNYDLAGIPSRRVQTFNYQCGCRAHQLSAVRHNRVLRKGARYLCKFCRGVLTAVQGSVATKEEVI